MRTVEYPTRAAPIDAAVPYERWSYGEGWFGGLAEGRRQGFGEGYGAGFDAGAEVGGARLLLAVESAVGGRLPDLLPALPQVAGYLCYRRRTAPTDEACGSRCDRCSRCIRAAAVATNVARFGRADFPGRAG